MLPDGSLLASRDARTLKLDATGENRREVALGGRLAVDGDGNAFLTGELEPWVAALDAELGVRWMRWLGRSNEDRPRAIVADERGGAVVTGSGLGTVALDAEGRTRWASPIAGSDLTSAPDGGVLVVGGFLDTVAIGGALHESPLPAVFVARLDGFGSATWSRAFSADGPMHAECIAAGADGSFVIAGGFRGTVNFGAAPLSWYGKDGEAYEAGFVAAFAAGGKPRHSRRTEIPSPTELVATPAGTVALTGRRHDAEPFLEVLVLGPDGRELWPPAERPQPGYGFDLAFGLAGALHFSLEAREARGSQLLPYLVELAF